MKLKALSHYDNDTMMMSSVKRMRQRCSCTKKKIKSFLFSLMRY